MTLCLFLLRTVEKSTVYLYSLAKKSINPCSAFKLMEFSLLGRELTFKTAQWMSPTEILAHLNSMQICSRPVTGISPLRTCFIRSLIVGEVNRSPGSGSKTRMKIVMNTQFKFFEMMGSTLCRCFRYCREFS